MQPVQGNKIVSPRPGSSKFEFQNTKKALAGKHRGGELRLVLIRVDLGVLIQIFDRLVRVVSCFTLVFE